MNINLAMLATGPIVVLVLISMKPLEVEAVSGQRMTVKEIKSAQDREKAEFSAPVAIVSAQGLVLIVDSQECRIKVFSTEGRYLRAFGSRGKGPGEFNSPADVDFFEGRIYVADRFNRRIQILDGEGRYVQSFRVPLNPEHICVLAEDRTVVSQLPPGITAKEKLIHCFDLKGEILWEREDSFFSGDRVYDTFRNFAILNKGSRADGYLVRKCSQKQISHFDKEGRFLGQISPSQEYPIKRLILPLGGRNKMLEGLCWDSCFFRDEFYLLAPESTREGDLGPGKQVFVLGQDGRTRRVMELPDPVKKIAVSDNRIFAIDTENILRVFGFETK